MSGAQDGAGRSVARKQVFSPQSRRRATEGHGESGDGASRGIVAPGFLHRRGGLAGTCRRVIWPVVSRAEKQSEPRMNAYERRWSERVGGAPEDGLGGRPHDGWSGTARRSGGRNSPGPGQGDESENLNKDPMERAAEQLREVPTAGVAGRQAPSPDGRSTVARPGRW